MAVFRGYAFGAGTAAVGTSNALTTGFLISEDEIYLVSATPTLVVGGYDFLGVSLRVELGGHFLIIDGEPVDGTITDVAVLADGQALYTISGISISANATIPDLGTVLFGGLDQVYGTDLTDELHGYDGADLIFAHGGDDDVFGEAGNDTLFGGAGDDVLEGGLGTDVAAFTTTRAQTTFLRGTGGSWTAVGPEGTDILRGIEIVAFSDAILPVNDALLQLPAPPPVTFTRAVGVAGGAEVYWQHTGGQVAVWLMNGTTIGQAGALAMGLAADATLVGAADLNGDGRVDLVSRNAAGAVLVSQLQDPLGASHAQVGFNPGLDWTLAATGDVNGDGRADLVWRGQAGQVVVWEMNGNQITGSGQVAFNPGLSWSLAGIGDLNGDGRDDFLWRGPAGQVAVWEMNGSQITGGGQVGLNPGTSWRLERTGDLDNDGRDDILWRGAAGQVAVWEMNGAALVGGGQAVLNPGNAWVLVDAGDYNGDGRDDVFWRGPNGEAAVWQMDGAAITGGGLVALNPGLSWAVVA